MKALLVAAAMLLALTLPSSARADAVMDWNGHAATALGVTAGQAPTVSTIHLAMVHGAIYDAVNAIDRGHQPYLVAPPAMPWDSQDAAAATAAYRVLVGIVPEQQPALAMLYAASLATVSPGIGRAHV